MFIKCLWDNMFEEVNFVIEDLTLTEIIAIIVAVCFVIAVPLIYAKYAKSKNQFWSKEYTGSAEASYARENLKERYAKGEITKEEFDKMNEDLP